MLLLYNRKAGWASNRGMVMTFRNQVTIVNAGIIGGLVWEYYRDAPLLSIGVTGVWSLLLANAILWSRWSRRKRKDIDIGPVQGR